MIDSTEYLLITLVSFCLAVAINSTSVYLQKTRRIYDRSNHGLLLHATLISVFWLIFVGFLSQLNLHSSIATPSWPIISYGLVIGAAMLFAISIRALGSGALINANFFQNSKVVSSSVYRYIKNPIYDSYLLLFLALGMIYGNAAYLLVALTSFIGLNIIESKVEGTQLNHG